MLNLKITCKRISSIDTRGTSAIDVDLEGVDPRSINVGDIVDALWDEIVEEMKKDMQAVSDAFDLHPKEAT